MLSNQDIPREVYGKWVEIMDKTQRQVPLSLLQPNRQVESGMEPDVQAKPISAARVEVEGIVEAPAPAHVEVHENVKANEWLTVNSKSGGTTQKSDQTTKAPTEQDFKVPRNETEHNEMVTRLTDGGSTPTEAEQIIAARKSAFNKASKQFKKNMVKPTKWNQRKANQSRKSAINPTIDHGY
jgi:2,4-dienoyl-CoA reductase-like NADH-dependent reductase (Old Yellow Enzyme family)